MFTLRSLIAVALAAAVAATAGVAPSAAAAVQQIDRAVQEAVRPGAPAAALQRAVTDAIDVAELLQRSLGAVWSTLPSADRAR